ncbi:acyltransferase [Streptomyces sp. AM 4-1-1]|uniref:acyltransferase family protein n=1 Tax=Streptomyces sp. AM 4-1-1 TaxID=3028710 RepID=UPI0023B937B8|nr:acyltransferase [Streptomyces sp. AM 4-1-1]WEH33346.1 acyltransferase [Streptomyces sp. AM 4-1-1]
MPQSDVQAPEDKPAEALARTAPPGGTERTGRAPVRLYALDGLRVLAALAVLAFHFTGIDKATGVNWGENPRELFPWLFPFTQYGSYGVQLFFIISGFVICLSAWGRTPGQFVRARFMRLFPAYWFSVVLAVLVYRLLPDGVRDAPSFSVALTNLTMFQVPLKAPNVVGAYWTLWLELCFYLVFLVVLMKEISFQRVYVFCWSWLILSALAQQDTGLPLLGTIAPALNTALFVAGIAMYLMYRFGPDLKLWLLLGASWLVMQSDLVEHGDRLRDEEGFHRSPYIALALVTVFYLLVLAVALHKLDRVRWRVLSSAGALVYPLYLVHEELGWALIRELYGPLGPWPTLAVTVAVLVLLSWLVHRFVERPSVRWLRTKL